MQNILNNAHVLVVDDENVFLNTLKFSMELEGVQVVAVNNALDALNVIKGNRGTDNAINIVITDIQMPEMNGVELISKIRKIDKKLPVIAISGHGTKKLLEKLITLKIEEYLDKPLKIDILLSKIKQILEKRGDIVL